MTENNIRLYLGLFSIWTLSFDFTLFAKEPLSFPRSSDMVLARSLKKQQAGLSSTQIASQVMVDETYKDLLRTMLADLENYLANFEEIFAAKISRIHKHEKQRRDDLGKITKDLKAKIAAGDSTQETIEELGRLEELHKPFGYVTTYENANEFINRFVGPKGRLLKSMPTPNEVSRMNQPGTKTLFVDTWSVPFFNSGLQTIAEAQNGVKQVLEIFRSLDLTLPLSVLRFTRLVALYARPEFDDVRRYKLLMFPTEEGKSKFGQERNDAATLGTIYPVDVPVFTNKPLDLGPVSFIFGQKVHLFGLVSHSKEEKTADGRIFTGPADFLEHDFAHAFFNLTPRIPGTDEQWELVHRRYLEIRDAVKDPKLKRMVRLVYYHFTHESGFTSLFDKKPESFDKELETIDELLHTRFHYDFILTDGLYASDDYKPYLKQAFQTVGGFFRDNFYEILATDSMCYRVLNNK